MKHSRNTTHNGTGNSLLTIATLLMLVLLALMVFGGDQSAGTPIAPGSKENSSFSDDPAESRDEEKGVLDRRLRLPINRNKIVSNRRQSFGGNLSDSELSASLHSFPAH